MKNVLAALTIAAFSTAAFAAGPSFAEADANADGAITMDEAKVALPEVSEDQIVAADANNDGSLSEEEYAALTAD